MAFYVTMVRSRKKLEKYFKQNKIRNKYIIDVKKIMEEEKTSHADAGSMVFFKILVLNKIIMSEQKNKDIYYIPNFSNFDMDIKSMLQIKNTSKKYHEFFNLLLFFEEFVSTNWLTDILKNLDYFDNSQIIKDY